MNRPLLLFVVSLFSAGLQITNAQDPVQAEKLLASAQRKASVDGDLKGAIEDYKKVIASAGANRALSAQALLRMAECHQKLGDIEAQTIYERVVRDYADQKDAATLARTRLGRGATIAHAKGDRAVWTGPKVDLFGRVSPDGRYVTYVDWAQFGNVAVHDLVANTDRFLTWKKTWEDLDGGVGGWSAISPDGKQVAYGWQANDKDIRVISLEATTTTEPRRLVTFGADDVRFLGVRDWSPDGKSLAIGLSRKDGTSQIGIASVADGTFRVLKTADWRGADRIAFSADSKYIAYDLPASDSSDQRDVFVLAVDGSRETPVVVHAGDDRVVGWSPDRKYMLFTSDRTGSNALWAVSMADGRPQGPAELLKADIGADSYPLGLTRSGGLFVYKNISSRDIKVARIDLNAGKLQGQTMHFPQGYMAHPQDPHWSPDGKYLAYQVRGGQEGLAIRSIETGEGRRMPRKLLYARDPRWSPDGKSLIVSGRDGKGRDGVYRVEVENGNLTPIVNLPRLGADPRWSADGTKIYYRDGQTPEGIVERDLQSGAEREVFRHPRLQNFEVSPDGRTLAVQTIIDPSTHDRSLLVVSIADGSTRELPRLTSQEAFYQLHSMAWTPDSRAILTAKRTAGRPELWSVDVGSGQLRKLDVDASDWALAMSVKGEDHFLDGGFSLSPDGRHIAFLMGKSAAEVWALENFLPTPATPAAPSPKK